MTVDVRAAERFVLTNGRLLDRHRLAVLLQEAPTAPELVCRDALERLVGPLVGLFCAGDGRHGSPVEGPVAFLRGGRWGFGDDAIRIGRMVKRFLLLVEDVPAQILGSLVVVELCLVCVAAVLSETEFGLTRIDGRDPGEVMVNGGRAVGVERYLCFVEALLVAVGPDLFAFGDALVEVDQHLFLIEFALLAGTRLCAGRRHFRSPWVAGWFAVSSGAGRPMWKPWA